MTQPPAAALRGRPAAAALPLVLLLACGTGCVEVPQAARLPSVRPSAAAPRTGQAHPAPRAGRGTGPQVPQPADRPDPKQPAGPPPASSAPSAVRVPARPEESVPAAQALSRSPVPAPRPSPGDTVSASAPRTVPPSAAEPSPTRSGPSGGPGRREPAAVG